MNSSPQFLKLTQSSTPHPNHKMLVCNILPSKRFMVWRVNKIFWSISVPSQITLVYIDPFDAVRIVEEHVGDLATRKGSICRYEFSLAINCENLTHILICNVGWAIAQLIRWLYFSLQLIGVLKSHEQVLPTTWKISDWMCKNFRVCSKRIWVGPFQLVRWILECTLFLMVCIGLSIIPRLPLFEDCKRGIWWQTPERRHLVFTWM